MSPKRLALLLMVSMLVLTACGGSSAPAAVPAATNAPAVPAAIGELTPIHNYPASSLQITCPPSAGGGTDVLVREMALYMEEYLNVPVTVVNKPGNFCAIGFEEGANDPTDGSAITCAVPELLGLAYTTDFPYTYRDFDLINNFNTCYGTVCVPADAPYDNIWEFVEYMKAHPGEVRFANSGMGGPWHLLAIKFAQVAGVDIVHVPYAGGGPAAVAVVVGDAEAVTVSDSEVSIYVRSGLMKMLMTFSPERLEDYPHVPTARESGYGGGTDVAVFRGFVGPKGMDREALRMVDEATRYALARPEVQQFMKDNGYTANYLPAQEFGVLLESMDKICSDITHEQGIAIK